MNYNARTPLVIGLPMTTAECNVDTPFVVVAGRHEGVRGARIDKTCYILCHQPKSFDWRAREAAPHPMRRLDDARFAEVRDLLNQIMQLA